MTDLTPNAVVTGLMQLARELFDATNKLAKVEREAVHARADHSLAFAKALLQSEGSNAEIRKAHATQETHPQRIAAELAEAEVRILREEIWTIKTRIDVGRSAAAALRAEIDLERVR